MKEKNNVRNENNKSKMRAFFFFFCFIGISDSTICFDSPETWRKIRRYICAIMLLGRGVVDVYIQTFTPGEKHNFPSGIKDGEK